MGSMASTMPSRKLGAVPTGTEVRNLRFFVQLGADAVPHELTHHAEAVGFHIFLHGRAHIAHGISHPRLLDALVQRGFGDFEQLALTSGFTDPPTGTVMAASP